MTNPGNPQPALPPRPGKPVPVADATGVPAGVPGTNATPTIPAKPTMPAKPAKPAASAAAKPAGTPVSQDELLASLNRNFYGGEQPATKAKRDSLAEMNKKLPDWNLEPPETFLP